MAGVTTSQEDRSARLATMKRRASALLVVAAGAFLALLLVPQGHPRWQGYALAAVEGSLVGGLADWFAVTALFRRPLGLPIPHTAIIRERKDQFGETLGSFVQENFLSPDVVSERIAVAELGPRLAERLQDPHSAGRLADVTMEALVAVADVVDEDEVRELLHDELTRAIASRPLGPTAARALRSSLDEGRQQALVEAGLRGALGFLDRHRSALRSRFGDSPRWWLPASVERRIFDELFDAARDLVASMAADPSHELRLALDERLRAMADRLEHDPSSSARLDALIADAMSSRAVADWAGSLWTSAVASLREQVAHPESSRLRARLVAAVVDAGGRLHRDPELQAHLTALAQRGARYVAEHHRAEISGLISATIARWDAEETSSRLELLLGPDLQFIRINGTVVGALAGLAIHLVADLVG
jgi:uncharacterized membrane-anchored protein YjiN (DUF445 family)